jgi:hypothetical protein
MEFQFAVGKECRYELGLFLISCQIILQSMFAFQDKDEHLQLMDGVLVDLLNAKWNTFVKFIHC